MTITIQLESGGRRDIDIDLITEYGREAPLFEIPPMPGGDSWPTYRSGKPFCYVKVRPFNEMFIITPQSLLDVHAAMQRREKA